MYVQFTSYAHGVFTGIPDLNIILTPAVKAIKFTEFNSIQPSVPFLYPLKTFGFLTFWRGMVIEHWAKMCQT